MKVEPNARAFPFESARDWNGASFGLTMRAYFAAKALQGLCAADAYEMWAVESIASRAIRQADALIAELNKENSND